MDMEAGEDEMEAGAKLPKPVCEEEEAVEKIVAAVVDAISQETGVDIEVEGEADDEEARKWKWTWKPAMKKTPRRDPAMMEDPAMRDPP